MTTTTANPAAETIVRTLIIKKRGRKYFECRLGDYSAQLIINDVSRGLDIERVVKIRCVDLSTRTKYGSSLKFEPVEILEDRDAKALYAAAVARNEAEKWLGYAESDAAQGNDHSRAILTALATSPEYTDLAARVAALRERVAANKSANQAAQAAAAKQRADERAHEQQRRAMRKLYPISALPRLAEPIRMGANVVVFESTGEKFRINEDHPSMHAHHLLGHEGEYGCYVYYRQATAAEIDALEQKEAAEKEVAARADADRAQIASITADIIAAGEQPPETAMPDGEVLLDSRTPYGGGDCFVVQPDAIWYIRNNGADGDDWSRNNVTTGGAGAIGWRVGYSATMADTLRRLAKKNLDAILIG